MECHANLDTISDQEGETIGRQKLVEINRTMIGRPLPALSILSGLFHVKPTDDLGIMILR